VVFELRTPEVVVVVNPQTMTKTFEHVRNLRSYGLIELQLEDAEAGGTHVGSDDVADRFDNQADRFDNHDEDDVEEDM